MKYHNKTNTCDRCGNKLPDYPRREYNKEGNWTGNWLCRSCDSSDYNKRPDCQHALMKSVSARRTGNLNPNSTQYKGDLGEKITCVIHNVENMNIINDNYNEPIDHTTDNILGILQSKLSTKYAQYQGSIKDYIYGFSVSEDKFKNFDNLIC